VCWFQNEGIIPHDFVFISLLNRFNEIIVFFDNDDAGITASIKKTIFQIRNERPSVIIYGKCTIMNNMATFSLVSKLPLNIIKKLVHTLPQ